jgi:glyoxylase-like metal-dependent hydrolase (beta-lactamase superfamily II)
MAEPTVWEVHALVSGAFAGRTRRQSFLAPPDPADERPMPVNYYVFALRSAGRAIVVDAGMDQADAARHGRRIDRLPREALARIGVDAGAVEDVILTHLRFDHCGTVDDFPRARFHLQEAEMTYATGRCMGWMQPRGPYDGAGSVPSRPPAHASSH